MNGPVSFILPCSGRPLRLLSVLLFHDRYEGGAMRGIGVMKCTSMGPGGRIFS